MTDPGRQATANPQPNRPTWRRWSLPLTAKRPDPPAPGPANGTTASEG